VINCKKHRETSGGLKMPVVGKPVPRKDALDKLRGLAKYIDDYNFSDILHVVTVRSPMPTANSRASTKVPPNVCPA